MAHYAKILDNRVVKVIVAEADFFDSFVDHSPGEWIQTSYNTLNNQNPRTNQPIRGNYAGIGYHYDRSRDVFYPPNDCRGWNLDENLWTWRPPHPPPSEPGPYRWDNDLLDWVKIS